MTSDKRSLSNIEAELDENRERMGQTLDVLQHRLSTESIAAQGRDYLRATGGAEFASNLGESVRRNPVPLTLLGVGMAWLMLSSSDRAGRAIVRNTPDSSQDSTNRKAGVTDKMTSASERTKSKAQDLYQQAGQAGGKGQEHINRASDRAQRGAAYVTDNARRNASRVGQATRRGSARVMDGADYMYREQPLITAALGLALGGIVAASLPRSRTEDQAMGSVRDDVVDSAWETGQEKAGQAQSVAESAAQGARDAASSEAERQGGRNQKNDPTSPREDPTR